MTAPKGTFSIAVFAKNEEHNIPFVVDSLLKKYSADRIVFVLDGNIGPTADILSKNSLRFIPGPNRGKGVAVRTAINHITSDVLVFMDADGSHDPAEIKSLLDPLLEDEAEMVIGSRFLGGSQELSGSIDNRIRCLGNRISNHIVNSVWNRTGTKISDSQNGFRAIKRGYFLKLNLTENSFSIEQEMIVKALKRGYRIQEVASFESSRRYGRSHVSKLHFIRYAACFIKNLP